MVLVEDERRSLPVELNGAADSVDTLTRRRRHVDEEYESSGWEDKW